MMAVSEHNLSCFCGQPLETITSPVPVHCPRCGLTITPARLVDSLRHLSVACPASHSGRVGVGAENASPAAA